MTGERLVCLMDSVFKYGSLNNGHSARRGMLKMRDIFINISLSSYPKGYSFLLSPWKLSYCCNLCTGEKFLRQLSESLLCWHWSGNEGNLHQQSHLDLVWRFLSGHGPGKNYYLLKYSSSSFATFLVLSVRRLRTGDEKFFLKGATASSRGFCCFRSIHRPKTVTAYEKSLAMWHPCYICPYLS